MSAALEAFWSQNKVIIESPLTASTGSALRSKFKSKHASASSSGGGGSSSHIKKSGTHSVNSPLSIDYIKANQFRQYFHSGSCSSESEYGVRNLGVTLSHKNAQATTSSSKIYSSQASQTVLTLPVNFDLTQVKELRGLFIENTHELNEAELCSPRKATVAEIELNNSIRKKLFDQNSDDLSSSTTTASSAVQFDTNRASANQKQQPPLNRQAIFTSIYNSGSVNRNSSSSSSRLPKPDLPTSFTLSSDRRQADAAVATHFGSSYSDDSFEFEDRQFSSSPKQTANRFIFCDMGDQNAAGNNNPPVFNPRSVSDSPNDDSVFMSASLRPFHRSPPDLSPLLAAPSTPNKQIFHLDRQVQLSHKLEPNEATVDSTNKHYDKSNSLLGNTGSERKTAKQDTSPQHDLLDEGLSVNILAKSVTRQHHNRYIHLEAVPSMTSNVLELSSNSQRSRVLAHSNHLESTSASKVKAEDKYRANRRSGGFGGFESPNLSPIRLQENNNKNSSKNKTNYLANFPKGSSMHHSKNKSASSSRQRKERQMSINSNNNDSFEYLGGGTASEANGAGKSTVFMEIVTESGCARGGGKKKTSSTTTEAQCSTSAQNVSFTESMSSSESSSSSAAARHYHREEIYTHSLYHDNKKEVTGGGADFGDNNNSTYHQNTADTSTSTVASLVNNANNNINNNNNNNNTSTSGVNGADGTCNMSTSLRSNPRQDTKVGGSGGRKGKKKNMNSTSNQQQRFFFM